jgi:hypothetical protein
MSTVKALLLLIQAIPEVIKLIKALEKHKKATDKKSKLKQDLADIRKLYDGDSIV